MQAEWLLALVYTALLVEAEFGSFGPIRPFVGHFLVVALLPFICVTAGRIWPYLVTLPFLALPICGKTSVIFVLSKGSTRTSQPPSFLRCR